MANFAFEVLKTAPVFILSILLSLSVVAQSRQRDGEVGMNLGFSNFLGDLGGSPLEGRPLWFDIDAAVTRPAVGVVYRQEVFPHWSVRANFYYSVVRGSDELTKNESRSLRNLSFRSPLCELTAFIEYDLFRFVGADKKPWTPFIYAGFGTFWFNPQAFYNGEWIDLQPLGTEGQGLPQYPDRQPYSLNALCFPIGGGIKYMTKNNWVFGLETACRLTNTDYIDDVSTDYPNAAFIQEFYDPDKAALIIALSDRSIAGDKVTSGAESQRGNPGYNDAYFMGGLFTITYHFERTKRPKPGSCYF